MQRSCYLLLVCLSFLSCKDPQKKDPPPAKVTMVWESPNEGGVRVYDNQAFSEWKTGVHRPDKIRPNATVQIDLLQPAEILLVYGGNWSDKYLVYAGDSLWVKSSSKSSRSVSKMKGNRFSKMKTVKEVLYQMDPEMEESDSLHAQLIRAKNDRANLKVYLERADKSFQRNQDSLRKINDPAHTVLAEYAWVEHYKKLSALFAVYQDKDLGDYLRSKDFINLSNFKNRQRKDIFTAFFWDQVLRNRKARTYDEWYRTGFESYEPEIQEYFKARVILGMYDEKWNRKLIISLVKDYLDKYGTNRLIDEVKDGIEYGVAESNDLKLKDFNGREETWESVIRKHKGKKIYVDFWASWCAPCIHEFQFKDQLKARLGNKVVFLYLALGDKEEKWKPAAEKYGITQNSYLVTNSKSSKFVVDHKIQSIPRYMIVDENGKIIHRDAPRPSGLIEMEVKNFFVGD